MKYIFVFIMLAFMSTANAGQCSVIPKGNLTDVQHSQLVADCFKKAEELTSSSQITETIKDPQKVSAWGTVAKDFAEAIGIAAKELGIAVNDFFQSDAGMFFALLIFWKIAGASILSSLITLLVFTTLIVVWVKALNKITERETKYEYKPVLWGMFNRKQIVSKGEYLNANGLNTPPGFFLFLAGIAIVVSIAIVTS